MQSDDTPPEASDVVGKYRIMQARKSLRLEEQRLPAKVKIGAGAFLSVLAVEWIRKLGLSRSNPSETTVDFAADFAFQVSKRSRRLFRASAFRDTELFGGSVVPLL
jgi:hypothetical protein